LIIFQRAKLPKRSITHLYRCNWRTFSMKNFAVISTRISCSCMKMPQLIGHLQPRRNWPTWGSNDLITHLVLRIWRRRTITCSLDWKNNGKLAIFLPKPRSLMHLGPGWTDKFLNFFEWLPKVRATG
jgi:hypothetical protein